MASYSENFDCAPALRLDAHEQLNTLQFQSLNRRLDKIEQLMERLERRLWVTLYGAVGVILAQAISQVVSGLS